MANVVIDELIAIADAYAEAIGKSRQTVSGQILGSNVRLDQIAKGESDVGCLKADRYISEISDKWPAGKTVPLPLLAWRNRQQITAHPDYSYDAHGVAL